MSGGKQTIYTDGACRNNGRGGATAGWGATSSKGWEANGRVPDYHPQTNSRAELEGVRSGLQMAKENIRSSGGGPQRTEVVTDSRYATDSMNNWMPNWEQNGWKTSGGKDVAHQDVLRDIRDLSRSSEFGGEVTFKHTRGHSGNPGNERADYLANESLKDNYYGRR